MAVDPSVLTEGVNNLWILVVTFLIFFMHAGFAMLEAGQVRAKNVANQLTKNLLTWSVGVSLFFLVGFGVSNLVAGLGFTPAFELAPTDWIDWLFGAVFAMTAATIVSGAVAGRAKLRAYVTYTIVLAAVIYPVVIGFTWTAETGLVASITGMVLGTEVVFQDFAGGMIVHGMGGIAGLTAAWILGPRLGRFDDDSVTVIPGHSITFAVLGTLMLAFGWYGFNVGTQFEILVTQGDGIAFMGDALGRVAMATTLSMAAGAMGAGLVAWLKTGKVDTLYVANGLLAGLVGITAIPNTTAWWGAFLVGGLAGAQLPVVFTFVEKRLHIDDVCAVFPVHGSAGILGALAFPFVAAPGVLADRGVSVLEAFVAQLLGVSIIAAWTVLATALVWGGLRAIGEARVSAPHERDGLDASEHGVETYPEFGAGEEPTVMTDGAPQLRTDGSGHDE
ncbi:ammonium transporter [Halorhabdus amylolytica]|uniref:ammonium transporter n=1 Tax=Halorhabdus amylolytica TaxID=2559573 RepID=UPI0020C062FF|nr:ammonium transporter [Halorhabdus amylolytica]